VADAWSVDGQIKTGDTVLVLGTSAAFNRRAADREDESGGYCHVSSDEKFGTFPHLVPTM